VKNAGELVENHAENGFGSVIQNRAEFKTGPKLADAVLFTRIKTRNCGREVV
jgi:hypothetical protein